MPALLFAMLLLLTGVPAASAQDVMALVRADRWADAEAAAQPRRCTFEHSTSSLKRTPR